MERIAFSHHLLGFNVWARRGERVLQQQADILGARFRRGSVSCYHPVVPEAVMTKTWEDTAHLFTCGKMTQGQTHGDEREVEMCAGDRFPVHTLTSASHGVGVCFGSVSQQSCGFVFGLQYDTDAQRATYHPQHEPIHLLLHSTLNLAS